MRLVKKISCFAILPLTATGISSTVHAGEYACKTDYRNSGLTAEQIAELCREEQLGSTPPPRGEDTGDGNTYPGRNCGVGTRIGDCYIWNPK
jgi:hypothetical protein